MPYGHARRKRVKWLLSGIGPIIGHSLALGVVIIMENIESSWNILMDINFKILQSKYFNDYY